MAARPAGKPNLDWPKVRPNPWLAIDGASLRTPANSTRWPLPFPRGQLQRKTRRFRVGGEHFHGVK